MIFSGFALMAIVCLADEPDICARYGLGWMTTAKACQVAARETKLALPLVVRLEGNNVEKGRQTLAESGLTIISGESMSDAAQKVVKAVAR